MLTPKQKKKIVDTYGRKTGDTGSPEVQIALLSEDIKQVTEHLKHHPKDKASRLGLVKMVHQRKKLLSYLKKDSQNRHDKLVKKLGLKK